MPCSCVNGDSTAGARGRRATFSSSARNGFLGGASAHSGRGGRLSQISKLCNSNVIQDRYSCTMPIPYRIGTTILDEIERVYDDITNRAYQVGFHGSGAYTLNIEDWLTAEMQMVRNSDEGLIE